VAPDIEFEFEQSRNLWPIQSGVDVHHTVFAGIDLDGDSVLLGFYGPSRCGQGARVLLARACCIHMFPTSFSGGWDGDVGLLSIGLPFASARNGKLHVIFRPCGKYPG